MARCTLLAILATALVATTPQPSSATTHAVPAWTVEAEWSAQGRPYCYIQTAPAAGQRLTVARAADQLILVVRLEDWQLDAAELVVDLDVDSHHRERVMARVDGRALVVAWPSNAAIAEALAAGQTLTLTNAAEADAELSLAGSTEAFEALTQCFVMHQAAHDAETARWRDPLKAAADPGPLQAETAEQLAADFERWLRRVIPDVQAQVDVPEEEAEPFALDTALGRGAIHLLPGDSHADVLAFGAERVRASCAAGGGRLVEHDRYDLNGLIVQRAGLRCTEGGPHVEAVIVSFADDPGGLAFVLVEDEPAGRAADALARLVEALATREGFVLRLAATAPEPR